MGDIGGHCRGGCAWDGAYSLTKLCSCCYLWGGFQLHLYPNLPAVHHKLQRQPLLLRHKPAGHKLLVHGLPMAGRLPEQYVQYEHKYGVPRVGYDSFGHFWGPVLEIGGGKERRVGGGGGDGDGDAGQEERVGVGGRRKMI